MEAFESSAVQISAHNLKSWPQCLPSFLWCLVQGCRRQVLLNMQRHLLLLSDGGLFLAHVCAGDVRRNEDFLLEPIHTVLYGQVIPAQCVHSEMAVLGRMGKGS